MPLPPPAHTHTPCAQPRVDGGHTEQRLLLRGVQKLCRAARDGVACEVPLVQHAGRQHGHLARVAAGCGAVEFACREGRAGAQHDDITLTHVVPLPRSHTSSGPPEITPPTNQRLTGKTHKGGSKQCNSVRRYAHTHATVYAGMHIHMQQCMQACSIHMQHMTITGVTCHACRFYLGPGPGISEYV